MTDKEYFEKLRTIIIMTKYDYLQYKTAFFGKDKTEKMYIINKTAPDFFKSLAEYYWERMIIGISKLTDPRKSGGNNNLSIAYVVLMAEENELKCKAEIDCEYRKCLEHVRNIRRYRSKIYGHIDLDIIESGEMKVTLEEIEQSFRLIETIMNLYHKEVEDCTWIFDLAGYKDIGSLFYYLEQALIYDYMKELRVDYIKDNDEEQLWRKMVSVTISETGKN
jgi:hypothetical protein